MFKTDLILSLISLAILLNGTNGSKISDEKIYKTLQSDFMCFRRFNGTNQFGCQSKKGGSVGTVHLVRSKSDIDYIIKSGPNDPYIPCLKTKYFTRENILKFRDSERVSGLVLFDVQSSDELPESFTEDRRCPNEMTSYYVNDETYGHCRKEEWNKYATIQSIYELNLDFPMILIRDQENITNIEKCFKKFNSKEQKNYEPTKSSDLLCSLQLKTWMIGAKSSKVCMSRSSSGYNIENVKFCDSISSFNVFSTLFKYKENEEINDRSIVVLTSRIDTLSIFDNSATGAQTTLTSLITLFSVINLLREQRDKGVLKKNGRNVLYALFDGESYDYIGSGKTAYDLGTSGLKPLQVGNKAFNLTLLKQHLHSAIELSQTTSTDKFYLHTDPLTRNKSTTKPIIDKLVNSLVSSSIRNVDLTDLPLPPSSVQQLLAHDHDLPVIVISNHETDFTNKFYNSFLDDERTIKDKATVMSKIADLSESIAKCLVELLLDSQPANDVALKADLELIGQLYDCFIVNIRCKFFDDIRNKPTRLLPHFKTYPLYTSTSISEEQQPYHHEYTILLSRLLSFLNRKNLDNITNQEQCDEMNKIDYQEYDWFNITDQKTNKSNEYCVESTKFYTFAISPVFLGEQPDWSLNYSTWTESVWNTPQVRLFVSPSRYQEYTTFFTGLIILLVSFFTSKWFVKNADRLFVDLVSDRTTAVQM